jgi:hypothetical protein
MPNWLYEAMAVGIVNGGAMAAITIPLYFFQRYLSKRSAGKKADGDPRLENLYLQLDQQHNQKHRNTVSYFFTIIIAINICLMAYFALGTTELISGSFLIVSILGITIIARLNEKRRDVKRKIEETDSEIRIINSQKNSYSRKNSEEAPPTPKTIPLSSQKDSAKTAIIAHQAQDAAVETSKKIHTEILNEIGSSHDEQADDIAILLQHDEDVRNMYEGVSGLPNPVKQSILREVLNNPKEEIMKIRNAVILASLKRPDLEWNDDLENLVVKCKTADPENVSEFFKVFPILSHRMSIHEIRLKVFQLSQKTFYVETIAGRDVLVTQIGDDIFKFTSLISGSVTLSSLDELYNYLGTPENRRYRKKSL